MSRFDSFEANRRVSTWDPNRIVTNATPPAGELLRVARLHLGRKNGIGLPQAREALDVLTGLTMTAEQATEAAELRARLEIGA